VGAKRIWLANQRFWKQYAAPLHQEIVFASTGTKRKEDSPWKYVVALAGSDIQTNPPATNDAVAASGLVFGRTVDQLPAAEVLTEIDAKVNFECMEDQLMREGVVKFAEPHKKLVELIAEKRRAFVSAGA
jgi:transaldolase